VLQSQTVVADGRFVLPIVLTPGEDGYIVASCPILPGCISQGTTPDEALKNIQEAARLTLANRATEGWDVPFEYHVTQVEVSA